ncbi:hypothetical protein ABG953_12590 [Enterococcus faecalis]|uniref:hypothetical protein n=1 Tax=Enterococcus faecalis TaxID=1351 RepID=UPI0019E2C7C6|nr:hypothetical protein [Enterococcus faecalis]EGO6705154.1 hypothetical protein [Enterococcus faecalis]
MKIFVITLIVLSVISIGIVLYRFFVQNQIQSVKINENTTKEFLKKFEKVKLNELSKHVMVIFVICLGLSISFILTAYSIYNINNKVEYLTLQNQEIKDEFQKIKNQQMELINKTGVSAYPDAGIKLIELKWEELFTNQDKKSQRSLETSLSQKLVPYFGLNTVLTMINIPDKTLDLVIEGDSQNRNFDIIKGNIEGFIDEISQVKNVTQVNLKMNYLKDSSHKTTYSCSYVRNNEGESFKLASEIN